MRLVVERLRVECGGCRCVLCEGILINFVPFALVMSFEEEK
jgi:hypothetical protein